MHLKFANVNIGQCYCYCVKIITGETVARLTYPTVLVYGLQAFHGHVSDVASSEENLSC